MKNNYETIKYLIICLILLTTGNFILDIVMILKIVWGVN